MAEAVLAEAFALTFTSLTLVLGEEAEGLAAVFADVLFFTSVSTGFLRGRPTDLFGVTTFGVVFAGLAVAVFDFAAERGDGLEAEVVFDFATDRNFACVRFSATLVFVVFAVVFTIILGRLESVSLIRISFHQQD